MKISRAWLQKYFDEPLPDANALADALTFHAFEIEEIAGDMMDVKVLPNRAADCLCHRGIAKELSAILNLPLKSDPLRAPLPMMNIVSPYLRVEIENPKKCLRYMGAVVKGVKVGPSPTWLKEALEAVNQRSINNIVDAANYVMLDIGQPLHTFDAKNLSSINIRDAKEGEKMMILSGEIYTVPKGTLLIADGNTGEAIGIAGIKGGKRVEVTGATTDLIIESANFDSTAIRRTAQALKLSTDASQRFQNRPPPELAAYGMRDVLALIGQIADGEVACIVDEYPTRAPAPAAVSVPLAKINSVLGADFSKEEVADVFQRLGLPAEVKGDTFTVTPPFERADLSIPEDLAEEAGRILGYDRVSAALLPASDVGRSTSYMAEQAKYRGIEKVKDWLTERGFTEISTQSFAATGDIILANPLDKAKPALRANLDENMKEAMARATYVAPLVLAPNEKPKLFEVGIVFKKEGEALEIKTSEPVSGLPEIQEDAEYKPMRYKLDAYRPFSIYPFIVRDISFWVHSSDGETPFGPDVGKETMEGLIREHAGPLLTRLNLLDRYEKEGRISYAFRLVFQSMDRTLTDAEVNDTMRIVSMALAQIGTVR